MASSDQTSVAENHLLPRRLPLVLLLFVGSGCAALIDEIVWFQLLELVIGSTAVSLGLLLGTFMGGMCLGSLLLPRLVAPARHPLRVYAALELGIALLSLVVLWGLPVAAETYSALALGGSAGLWLRTLLCAVCLLAPAMLMGATLPAVARFVGDSPRALSWLGWFYGGNTLGAVVGCLAAGFYLLRVYDLAATAYVAVGLNLIVAFGAFGLARAPFLPTSTAVVNIERSAVPQAHSSFAPLSIYLALALSGFTALGAEVIWTRQLALLLAGTTYTFSIILAVFLTGIGLGSIAAARAGRLTRDARLALATCQLALVPAIAWAAWALGEGCYLLPLDYGALGSLWITMARDVTRSAWAILPAACLWGASFPLGLAALAGTHRESGRLVGGLYAANTLGAIAGAISASLLLMPGLGTRHTEQILMASALVASLGVLSFGMREKGVMPAEAGRSSGYLRRSTSARFALWLVPAIAAVGLIVRVPDVPFELIAYGRDAYKYLGRGLTELYRGEGLNSTVAVSEGDQVRQFHVAGKVEASTELADMRLERLLANLPALIHPAPRSVLVVGCGAGVTAGAFLPYYSSVERLVICDIEPLVPRRVAPLFAAVNLDVVNDRRVEIVYDDARHYLRTTAEKFDIITSDPIHPYVKGAAMLFTEEYFEMVRSHLQPGGLVTQWIPLYESSVDTVRTEVATFDAVFPHATAWCNTKDGQGYDLVLLGSLDPLRIDLDELHSRLQSPEFRAVRRYLEQVGFRSELDVLATYTGDAAGLQPWLAGAAINHDRDLRLQYLAGELPEFNLMDPIYRQMLAHRTFPASMVSGSAERVNAFRGALETSVAPQPAPHAELDATHGAADN